MTAAMAASSTNNPPASETFTLKTHRWLRRQSDDERRTRRGGGREIKITALYPNQFARDRKTKPGAAGTGRAGERHKQIFKRPPLQTLRV